MTAPDDGDAFRARIQQSIDRLEARGIWQTEERQTLYQAAEQATCAARERLAACSARALRRPNDPLAALRWVAAGRDWLNAYAGFLDVVELTEAARLYRHAALQSNRDVLGALSDLDGIERHKMRGYSPN